MTKMIVGLGNPGERYDQTRHNMGFMIIDLLVQELGLSFRSEKSFVAEMADTFINHEKVFFVKPQTFMNESGRAVKPLLTYYNLEPKDLLVIVDDMDSPVGRVRFRQRGSSGGQRGIKSLLVHLGTDEWKRVKIGVGRPKEGWTVVNHVLSKFEGEEAMEARTGILKATEGIKFYLETGDFSETMNQYNG